MTDSILKNGISAPMPYSLLFSDTIDPDLFKVKPIETAQPTKEGKEGILDWIARIFHFPNVPQGFSLRNVYREVLAPLMIPPVIKELKDINKPSVLQGPIPNTQESQPIREIQKMSGGGHSEQSGPGPVIAGALTAVVLAGGLKGFYDVVVKRYG
jgi:hypothetical protein